MDVPLVWVAASCGDLRLRSRAGLPCSAEHSEPAVAQHPATAATVRGYGRPFKEIDMSERTCSVCERKHYARGLCKAHYRRIYDGRGLNPDKPLRELPGAGERDDVVTRILDKAVHLEGGCIEWRGTCNAQGYGQISWRGKKWMTHRAMWTAQVGPIPNDDDWTLDHLCFNRACVNVKHMEVVTRIENSRRGGGLERAIASNKIRYIDVCRNGHPRTPENTSTQGGKRRCLQCSREAYARRADQINAELRERYAAKRAAGVDWRSARLA